MENCLGGQATNTDRAVAHYPQSQTKYLQDCSVTVDRRDQSSNKQLFEEFFNILANS